MRPNRFREAREYLGLGTKECCRFLKVRRDTLELLEAGQAVPTQEVLAAAVRLYGRPADWLLGGPEEQLEVPRGLLDLARGARGEVSSGDALELARFAQYLRHRAQTRGLA